MNCHDRTTFPLVSKITKLHMTGLVAHFIRASFCWREQDEQPRLPVDAALEA